MKNDNIFLQKMAKVYAQEDGKTLDDLNLTPTDGMVSEAKRGLAWRDEYNRGGTAVGIARARDISNRKRLSPGTVMRMHSFFSRHEVDKKGKGFSSGEGYPSNGRIAWALWGGDAGQAWARKMSSQIKTIREKSGLMISEGDFVTFTVVDENETEIGRVEYVMTEGYFSIPESKYYTAATPQNPALLIRIFEEKEETEYMVGKLFNEVQLANLDEYEANEVEDDMMEED